MISCQIKGNCVILSLIISKNPVTLCIVSPAWEQILTLQRHRRLAAGAAKAAFHAGETVKEFAVDRGERKRTVEINLIG